MLYILGQVQFMEPTVVGPVLIRLGIILSRISVYLRRHLISFKTCPNIVTSHVASAANNHRITWGQTLFSDSLLSWAPASLLR